MKKKCSGCGIEKDYDDFHKRSISPDGKDTKCKICRSVYVSRIPTGLNHAPEQHRIPAEEILRGLGYELYNSDNPVYLQFKRRMTDKGIDTSGW